VYFVIAVSHNGVFSDIFDNYTLLAVSIVLMFTFQIKSSIKVKKKKNLRSTTYSFPSHLKFINHNISAPHPSHPKPDTYKQIQCVVKKVTIN
jgi:hypothetical protein